MRNSTSKSSSVIWISTLSIGLVVGCSSGQKDEGGESYPVDSSARVEYDSNQLMMKSADEIAEIIRKKMKKAQNIQAQQTTRDEEGIMAEDGAVRQLKDAMRIVLSRPDQDGTRAPAFARLRRDLQDLNSLDRVLAELGAEGIGALKSSETTIRHQATYVVLLENLIAELRPEMNANANFKNIITEIRDAKIKISDKLRSQALLNSMSVPQSPSDIAKNVLAKDGVETKKKKK